MTHPDQQFPDLDALRRAQHLISGAFGGQSEEAEAHSADRFARWQAAAFAAPQAAYEPSEVKLFPIPDPNHVELITIKATAYSSCEHHFAPAWLKATIGYVPGTHFVGYSKIVKMFRHFAARYTMDERICNDFLAEFQARVEPAGSAISMRGKHFCVISRGGLETDFPLMNAYRGVLREDPLRREFWDAARTSWENGT
jgi:GTP cyclohydrolase I